MRCVCLILSGLGFIGLKEQRSFSCDLRIKIAMAMYALIAKCKRRWQLTGYHQ